MIHIFPSLSGKEEQKTPVDFFLTVEQIKFLFHYWKVTADAASQEFHESQRYFELTRRLCDFEKLIGQKMMELKSISVVYFEAFLRDHVELRSIWWAQSSKI